MTEIERLQAEYAEIRARMMGHPIPGAAEQTRLAHREAEIYRRLTDLGAPMKRETS